MFLSFRKKTYEMCVIPDGKSSSLIKESYIARRDFMQTEIRGPQQAKNGKLYYVWRQRLNAALAKNKDGLFKRKGLAFWDFHFSMVEESRPTKYTLYDLCTV